MARGGILEMRVFLEGQRGRIEAKAQTSGFGAIFKNVPQVSPASNAFNFGPIHPVTMVRLAEDVLLSHRLKEAGPACAGIKFRFRSKQGQAATNAIINARLMLVIKSAAESRFGALVARDAKLLGCQLLGPFRVGFDNFRGGDQRTGKSIIIEKSNLDHRDWIGGGVLGGSRRGLRLRMADNHTSG